MLKKWLKAGYLEQKVLHPTKEGTPQGGIVSPVLANMTLDGLEALLQAKFPHNTKRNGKYYAPMLHLIRYADDFIITGTSKELQENEVKPLVEQFFMERGLQLEASKTVITHIEEGFDALSDKMCVNTKQGSGTNC